MKAFIILTIFGDMMQSYILFKLNSDTDYGFENNISKPYIEQIIKEVENSFNSDIKLNVDEVIEILNSRVDIKNFALDKYTPYEECETWTNEEKEIYRQKVRQKKATGYGLIPYELVRSVVLGIFWKKIQEEIEWEEKLSKAKLRAYKTGICQVVKKYSDKCNIPNSNCSFDIITIYVTPEGEVKSEREHIQ